MLIACRDYGVKVIRPFDTHRVGDIIFPDGSRRAQLVRDGYVVKILVANGTSARPDK